MARGELPLFLFLLDEFFPRLKESSSWLQSDFIKYLEFGLKANQYKMVKSLAASFPQAFLNEFGMPSLETEMSLLKAAARSGKIKMVFLVESLFPKKEMDWSTCYPVATEALLHDEQRMLWFQLVARFIRSPSHVNRGGVMNATIMDPHLWYTAVLSNTNLGNCVSKIKAISAQLDPQFASLRKLSRLIAISSGDVEVMKFFLESGVDFFDADSISICSCLPSNGNLAAIEFLIERNCVPIRDLLKAHQIGFYLPIVQTMCKRYDLQLKDFIFANRQYQYLVDRRGEVAVENAKILKEFFKFDIPAVFNHERLPFFGSIRNPVLWVEIVQNSIHGTLKEALEVLRKTPNETVLYCQTVRQLARSGLVTIDDYFAELIFSGTFHTLTEWIENGNAVSYYQIYPKLLDLISSGKRCSGVLDWPVQILGISPSIEDYLSFLDSIDNYPNLWKQALELKIHKTNPKVMKYLFSKGRGDMIEVL